MDYEVIETDPPRPKICRITLNRTSKREREFCDYRTMGQA